MQTELKDQRIPVMMAESEVKKLDAWRREQDDLPSRGEAIRRLIELGLGAAVPKTEPPDLTPKPPPEQGFTDGGGPGCPQEAAPGVRLSKP